MDLNRKLWNEQQKQLRGLLAKPVETNDIIKLFLQQHAMLHDPIQEIQVPYSFSTEVWDGMDEKTFRWILPGEEHSIAWNIWHIARIEDMTMNGLVAGEKEIFRSEDWATRMNIPFMHSGNNMTLEEIRLLSNQIDLEALRKYRAAVAESTRLIIRSLSAELFKQKVKPERLEFLANFGSVLPEAESILAYWSHLTVAGLLLMPPTRHSFIHLNECRILKQKCCRKIFSSKK